MDIGKLYTRACFRFYREENQNGAFDTLAISRIYNHEDEEWNVLVISEMMEGEKIYSSLEELYEDYFESGNYKSIEEIPFTLFNKEVLRNIKNQGTWVYDEIMPNVKLKEVKQTTFETSDGRVFLDKGDAENHEIELISTRHYRVHHSPDLNETGRMTDSSVVKVIEYDKSKANDIIEKWCLDLVGPKIAYIQGVTETGNWSYHEISTEDIGENERVFTAR